VIEMLTCKHAAQLVGASPITLARAIARAELPAIDLTPSAKRRRYAVAREHVLAWDARRKSKTP
jgi:hypothetical protein